MTRTFSARYSILDPDPMISLGMSATLSIAAPGAQPAVLVPLSALYNQGSGAALWRVDADGRLQLVPVKLLRYEANSALVTGGVAEGDKIVVIGVHKLDAGQKVRVISRDSL
jgi:multidrug efflux pump subunit AcrA (membrane-fusion protein)